MNKIYIKPIINLLSLNMYDIITTSNKDNIIDWWESDNGGIW